MDNILMELEVYKNILDKPENKKLSEAHQTFIKGKLKEVKGLTKWIEMKQNSFLYPKIREETNKIIFSIHCRAF